MDSLTQVTLGAAVGEALLGRHVGRKAALWGAALGLLPDLDVLANPLLTEMGALRWHRSFSHSILFVLLAAPLIGGVLGRLHKGDSASWRAWTGMAAAALATHVALDVLTTYGTQVFWPFSNYPLIVGSVFIIDPLYTIPLLGGLLIGFRWAPDRRPRRMANYVGLALSTAYLLFTVGGKLYVEHVFDAATERQGIDAQRIFTKPSAFNSVLWTGVAEAEEGFYVGLYSLLDGDTRIAFRYVAKNHNLLGDAADSEAMQTLKWFSRGYFIVSQAPGGTLRVHDLRFPRSDLGLTDHGEYIFTFELKRDGDGAATGIRQVSPPLRSSRRLVWLLIRRVLGFDRAHAATGGGPSSTAPEVTGHPVRGRSAVAIVVRRGQRAEEEGAQKGLVIPLPVPKKATPKSNVIRT